MRPLRRSQLISPFGVGAITDFRGDEALMCAGLDVWFDGKAPPADYRVTEERLQHRLGKEYFVLPPDWDETGAGPRFSIPYVRFPLWHYCPACFRMRKTTLFGDQPYCEDCPRTRRKRRRMIPVRFVAICEAGHIEDFPFREWIGCTCGSDAAANLTFKPGRSAASLAGIRIECTKCHVGGSMAGAFRQDSLLAKGIACQASRPWLGETVGAAPCGHSLSTVQRGASNVYFSGVTSSIYIPPSQAPSDPAIANIIDDAALWPLLSMGLVDGRPNPTAVQLIATQRGVSADALAEAVTAKLRGSVTVGPGRMSEEAFRHQEYVALARGGRSEQLVSDVRGGSDYGWLADFINEVALVKKLRETRVLHGFSRMVPHSDPTDAGVQPLSAVGDRDWLPAVVVNGEGIFMKFNADRLGRWADRPEVGERVRHLISGYMARRANRGLAVRTIDARFILIHTLAHVLIRELTFMSGYGSASLRERLYFNAQPGDAEMMGLLIYTASGDADGTLGGLVQQGEPVRLQRLFESALRRAGWCSNDPVCIESPGQGADSANLAACHGCALVPETSCEEGNRLLDRALLVGTIESSGVAFFAREETDGSGRIH
ncbi:MAG TPA: DUF1998 domain-containing protein [Fimbriimonas sp.]|nr:DUF1998 domain-containing protein [Fimbriimonas sp.]